MSTTNGLARLVLLAAAWLAACSGSKGKTRVPVQKPRTATLVATAELKGTVEPCGCTADPLGDLARTAELVTAGRETGNTLFIDGGSNLYSNPVVGDSQMRQEELKAQLIADALAAPLAAAAVGLGPYDLAMGPAAVTPPRMVANLPAAAGVALEAAKVVPAGDVQIGIFGVISPTAAQSVGLEASDPVPAAEQAIASLRDEGADAVVAIAHMTRKEAQALARSAPGVDFILYGQNLPANAERVAAEPDQIGETWLFAPVDRGQVVSVLGLTVRGKGGFADAIGESRAAKELATLAESIPKLEAEIQKWEADSSSDKSFLATQKEELAAMRTREKSLRENPVQAPDSGNYFTLDQVEINKTLPCNAGVVAAKQAYDKAAGEANVAATAGHKPPEPEKGKAGYVGVEECSFCHGEAVEFWKTTKHYKAWDTLVVDNKQFNYDCISCHVTGWDRPGGSTIAVNEHLQDVQCEVCHGPGSLHVDAKDKLSTISRAPTEDTCIGCHNEEHSDTFDFKPYLRDITGKGHAEEFRKSLGDGPTGQELRSKALAAAGKVGAGCPK